MGAKHSTTGPARSRRSAATMASSSSMGCANGHGRISRSGSYSLRRRRTGSESAHSGGVGYDLTPCPPPTASPQHRRTTDRGGNSHRRRTALRVHPVLSVEASRRRRQRMLLVAALPAPGATLVRRPFGSGQLFLARAGTLAHESAVEAVAARAGRQAFATNARGERSLSSGRRVYREPRGRRACGTPRRCRLRPPPEYGCDRESMEVREDRDIDVAVRHSSDSIDAGVGPQPPRRRDSCVLDHLELLHAPGRHDEPDGLLGHVLSFFSLLRAPLNLMVRMVPLTTLMERT